MKAFFCKLTKKKFLLLLIYILFVAQKGFPQKPVYKNYSVADGLPSQTIYSVMQDKKGFIWISTDAGISRFDGVKFTNFTTNDGLADNEIFHIFEDSKGRYWFITFNGKPCYYFNGKFYNAGNDPLLKKIKATGPLRSVYEDSRHTLWFGTANSSIAYLTEKGEVDNIFFRADIVQSFSVYFYEPGNGKEIYFVVGGRFYSYIHGTFQLVNLEPVSEQYDNAFYNISIGKAVYVSDKGVVLLSGKETSLIECDDLNPGMFKGTLTIYSDNNGNIWIANIEHGVLLLQKEKGKKYKLNQLLLKGKQIIRVFGDNENNTWFVSSGNGIYRLSALNFTIKSFTAEDGLYSNSVTCLKTDAWNNLWVGHNSGFLTRIKEDGEITKFDCSFNNDRYARVIEINCDRENNVWVGTDNGLEFFKSLPGNNFEMPMFVGMDHNSRVFPFKSLAFDRNNQLSVTYSHGLGKLVSAESKKYILAYGKSIPYQRSYTNFYDHNNNLWMANLNGLGYVKNDSLVYVNEPDDSPFPRISDISESQDSVLLLGTYGFGILFFRNGKIINHFNEANGLAGNLCKKIVIRNDTVYVATLGGLSCFVYRKNVISAIKKISVSDGLLSNVVNDVDVKDKYIYVATSQGVSILPVSLQNSRSARPTVYITALRVNGKEEGTGKQIKLGYQNQYLQFNFIAPVFDRPENVIYSYKMGSSESTWTETKNNSVEFSSPEPGEYVFSVKAKKDNSEWSEPAQLKFFIAPPFWETGWFRLLVILLISFTVYLIIFFRINHIKNTANEKTELSRKIAGLEMKALRAQMNPHFTFNVMNSIQNYIVNNDTDSALRYLSKFAKLIRIILDNSQSPVIKLSEELNALEIYMELEKMRFKEKFNYEIIKGQDIDIAAILIPSMLLQPYVENAIKHGIMHKQESGRVFVSVNKLKDSICCVIEDNGIGRNKAEALKSLDSKNKHISLGSQIALNRIEAFNISNNTNIQVKVEDIREEENGDTGTRVLIYIPLI